MTSSTKPEVRNILHCRQRKTEPRPQVTCSENLANFRHVDFEIYERADRQTDLLIEKHFCHTMRTLFALIPTVLSSTRRNMKVYGCVVLVITFLVPSVHSDRGKQHQQLDAFFTTKQAVDGGGDWSYQCSPITAHSASNGTFHIPILFSELRRFVDLVQVRGAGRHNDGYHFNMSMNFKIASRVNTLIQYVNTAFSADHFVLNCSTLQCRRCKPAYAATLPRPVYELSLWASKEAFETSDSPLGQCKTRSQSQCED